MNATADTWPVIAIDGPAASGKGTIAQRVAQALAFRYLDSGSLYRLVALRAQIARLDLDDGEILARAARALDVDFPDGRVILDGVDVTEAIRNEAISAGASKVAIHAQVRTALLSRQRAFRGPPGLVAEGRDMGTVVFPEAI